MNRALSVVAFLAMLVGVGASLFAASTAVMNASGIDPLYALACLLVGIAVTLFFAGLELSKCLWRMV